MVFRKRSGFVYEVALLAKIYLALIKNLVSPLNHEGHLNKIGWRFLHLSTSRTVRPKKKNCLFPVTRPTLPFHCRPYVFLPPVVKLKKKIRFTVAQSTCSTPKQACLGLGCVSSPTEEEKKHKKQVTGNISDR